MIWGRLLAVGLYNLLIYFSITNLNLDNAFGTTNSTFVYFMITSDVTDTALASVTLTATRPGSIST